MIGNYFEIKPREKQFLGLSIKSDESYRHDVDGIRAIAVLSVLLFHCEVSVFGGGYVGVDIFFVISGFLITRNILGDLQSDAFTFRHFYFRRVQRLFPALIATLVLTLLVGLIVMSPPDLAATSRAAGYSALSLSNFYFSRNAGYFDPESDLNPILHTWSLSVEEQFYLLWPITLVLLFRYGGRSVVFLAVVAGILLGLILSEVWVHLRPQQAYFLTPFRGFEFMLGAVCVWLTPRRLARPSEARVFAAGLALMVLPVFLYDAQTPFPGLYAFVPALGTALLLWTGQIRAMQWLLGNAVLTWIGRISYSVYLVHWPIVVFRRYTTGEPFTVSEQVALAFASVLAGWLLHVIVERRFRIRTRQLSTTAEAAAFEPGGLSLRPFLVTLSCLLSVAAISFGVARSDGVPQRISLRPTINAYMNDMSFAFLRDYDDGTLNLGSGRSGRRVLVVGDSMMQNYIPALLTIPEFAAASVDVFTRGGCFMGARSLVVYSGSVDKRCEALRDSALASLGQYDLVIWGQNWHGYVQTLALEEKNGWPRPVGNGATRWREVLASAAPAWAEKGRRLVVFGPQVIVEGLSPLIARTGLLYDIDHISTTLDDTKEASPDLRDALSNEIASAIGRSVRSVKIVEPATILCGERSSCVFHDGMRSYFFDRMHYAAYSTNFIADRLKDLLSEEIRYLQDR